MRRAKTAEGQAWKLARGNPSLGRVPRTPRLIDKNLLESQNADPHTVRFMAVSGAAGSVDQSFMYLVLGYFSYEIATAVARGYHIHIRSENMKSKSPGIL